MIRMLAERVLLLMALSLIMVIGTVRYMGTLGRHTNVPRRNQ